MSDEVDCNLGLWEELIPQAWGKIVGYASQDAEEVGFEVAYGHLGSITSVTSRWHLFHVDFAHVTNVVLHVF